MSGSSAGVIFNSVVASIIYFIACYYIGSAWEDDSKWQKAILLMVWAAVYKYLFTHWGE